MISTAVLWIIYSAVFLLTSPIRLLSDVSVTNGFGSAVTTASTYIGTFDKFFPVSTLLILVGLFTSIEIGIALYKIIMWIIKRIPTQS